jgi:hypothetical protein
LLTSLPTVLLLLLLLAAFWMCVEDTGGQHSRSFSGNRIFSVPFVFS